MRFLVILISLLIISCALHGVFSIGVQAQEKPTPAKPSDVSQLEPGKSNRKDVGPVVESWAPKTASVDSIIYLSGYRLFPDHWDKAKAFFIQNGVEFPARSAGGWWTTNNQLNLPQTLRLIVPEELVPGPAQIVVEFEGRRTKPETITIEEWKLPVIERLDPTSGAPGTLVRIEGDGFHFADEIQVTDSNDKPLKVMASGQAFGIPEDAAEGILMVRVGNAKYGKAQFTAPVTFTVTNAPLPVELLTKDTIPVAPGQWLDLQISNSKPLERSARTEVVFIQGEQTIVVTTPKPFRPHVEVPRVLSPGEVQLQLRTWGDGQPSQWSEPASIELTDKPIAPLIDSIRIGKGNWTALSPGPDRPASIRVSPGDEVVLSGLWPVADASKLKVSLVRPGEGITMPATEFDEKATWLADIQVRLPESLAVGEWRMIVSSEADGTKLEVPIAIRVEKK